MAGEGMFVLLVGAETLEKARTAQGRFTPEIEVCDWSRVRVKNRRGERLGKARRKQGQHRGDLGLK